MFHKCLSSLHESHANLCIVQNVVYMRPKQAQGSYLEARRRASGQKDIRTVQGKDAGQMAAAEVGRDGGFWMHLKAEQIFRCWSGSGTQERGSLEGCQDFWLEDLEGQSH